jgi:hypothetical protein
MPCYFRHFVKEVSRNLRHGGTHFRIFREVVIKLNAYVGFTDR